MTTDVLPVDAPAPPPPDHDGPAPRVRVPRRSGPLRRLWRGRPEDPAWVRPALVGLLVATAALYLWDLGASGWANSFYSAAVQAGTRSWKAFFFGSSDAANFITVDKPPASLWVMELSARVFGLNTWSILVPQALEGVATVAVLYATVRRSLRPGPALLAGAVLATTPVAALMFRYNNPDALLVLLLTVAAYATVRALERASSGWLVLAMAAVGTGFITKMLQAFLVVPAIAVVYLVAAPAPLRRRLGQLAAAGAALVASAGWWVVAVELTPAADRPYIGGSTDNNLLNLIFGYNGLGRLSGSETGSVGGAGAAGSRWGPTGLLRFFNADFGTQISWLIPAAVVLAAAGLWVWRSRDRTDRARAGLLLWSGYLVVTVLVISLGRGIIHPYYSVAAAPAVGALVAMGGAALWERRHARWARAALAVALAATAVWADVLLDRAPGWFPWLRTVVLVVGLGAALALVVVPTPRRRLTLTVAAVGVCAALAGPAAYALDTAATPHDGAIPSAGPASATAAGLPGGAPAGGPVGLPGGIGRHGAAGFGAGGAATGAAGPGSATGAPAGGPGSFAPPTGITAGGGAAGGGAAPSGAPPVRARTDATAGLPGGAGRVRGGPGGAGGGFLSVTTPGRSVVAALERDAAGYTWVAATVNSNSAAGYQLATGDPVMAIGGFNGTDPAPTLAQFERDVAGHEVHYFIAGGTGGPGTGASGDDASRITSWVESHFSATTVDGVTLYDLSSTR